MFERTIGVDISKDSLDVMVFPEGVTMTVANDPKGWKAVVRLAAKGGGLVVFEPTGAYHRGLETALTTAQLPFAKVNPRQVKRFGDALGARAKTDRADAELLARYGAMLRPSPTQPMSETMRELKELYTARQGLSKDRTAALVRQKTAVSALLKRQIAKRIVQVDADMAAVDERVAAMIRADASLARRLDILVTIPGIATVSAVALLIEMPELGELDGKAAASLAGLAPMTRQSGKWSGKAFIRGGRAALRRALYMPAVAALRFNPGLSAKYKELVAVGKPPKLALTAIMRKLLILANALLRDGREWSLKPA